MTEPRHYLQFPTCHNRQLAFVSEDDLWLCDLNTMHTRRVTTDFGTVKNPRFSPNGQQIAFSSDREGSIEAYVVSVAGGNPIKLTYTGAACLVTGWSNDDTVIVASAHQSPFREGMLYHVPACGGSLAVIPVGPANAISYSPDQKGMVIQRHGYGYPSWKRYQGGTAAELWLKRDAKSEFAVFCKQKMNMLQPVWHQDRIYFISDFQGHGNVYSADLEGGSLRRHTQCEGFYVRNFCIDGDAIIYAQQGQLYRVAIDVTTDAPLAAEHLAIDTGSICHHKTRRYDFTAKTLEDIAPNHNASSVALCHRGRLFVMPSFQGPALLLDHNQQQRYRHCLWLQKTARVFAICDDGNKDYPAVFQSDQPMAPAKRWQSVNLGKVLCLMASPTEDKILIANNRHELHLFDMKTGKLVQIAHSAFGTISQFDWSSDGKWICYRQQNSHETAQIMLYDVKKATQTTVTNGLYHDYSPCFDPDGQYLYFLSHRSLTPKGDGLCFQYNFTDTTLAYVCCLQSKTTNPFYHQVSDSDDDAKDDKNEKEGKDDKDDKNEKDDKTVKAVEIDLDGIAERILPFPVPASSATKLLALSGKVLFITASWADNDADCEHDDGAGSVSVYDFKELKFEPLFDGITGAQLSHNRAFLCYSNASKQIRIIPAGAKPDDKDTSYRKGGLIDHQRARVAITPATEWPFMLREAWRLQRDFFWDRDMADVDWDATLARYLTVAERVTTRAELSDLIGELHGELGSSHAYIMGGDLPPKRQYRQGLLGAETTYDPTAKAYRISTICDAQDVSSTDLISPLRMPGVALSVGDHITAVNGVALGEQLTPECALEQQAGQYVQLSVRRANDKAKKQSSKNADETVIIKASAGDHERVYRAWVEKNRAYVHEHSQGKLGYIHIPDMSKDGYAEFLRSFLPSFDCDGLVVDVRFNGGGHVSSLILQKLALKRFGLDKTRWHEANLCYPANAPKGCMVGLCNEYAGSDGDMFSYAFKKMQLGTLVGKRTWGGVIGINVRHALLDGGVTTQPEYAIWLEGVGYGVENHGVDPDEVVEITPEQAASGLDPQLDRAIAIAMEELKTARYADLDQQLADTKIPSRQAPKLPSAALIEA